jgi:hypothetical protein
MQGLPSGTLSMDVEVEKRTTCDLLQEKTTELGERKNGLLKSSFFFVIPIPLNQIKK